MLCCALIAFLEQRWQFAKLVLLEEGVTLEGSRKGEDRVEESTSMELVIFEGNSKGEGESEALLLELTLLDEVIFFCHSHISHWISTIRMSKFSKLFRCNASHTQTNTSIHLA